MSMVCRFNFVFFFWATYTLYDNKNPFELGFLLNCHYFSYIRRTYPSLTIHPKPTPLLNFVWGKMCYVMKINN